MVTLTCTQHFLVFRGYRRRGVESKLLTVALFLPCVPAAQEEAAVCRRCGLQSGSREAHLSSPHGLLSILEAFIQGGSEEEGIIYTSCRWPNALPHGLAAMGVEPLCTFLRCKHAKQMCTSTAR